MNNLLRSLPVLALVLATACSGAPKAEEPAAPRASGSVVRARGEAAGLKIVFAVEAVDVEKRQVTLRGPGGRVGTYKVSPEVKRLSEVHAGDTILADYRVGAVAELRGPSSEEAAAPLVIAEMVDRNPANLPPGGTLARSVRVVVAIDAVNTTAGTIILKGPLNGDVVAKVDDPSVMSQLRPGANVVVTFAETLTLLVEPGASK